MKLFLMVALALTLFLTALSPAMACDMPTPGTEYGQHISDMAQMCDTSSMLGKCVSTMSNGSCTCSGMMDGSCTCNMGM